MRLGDEMTGGARSRHAGGAGTLGEGGRAARRRWERARRPVVALLVTSVSTAGLLVAVPRPAAASSYTVNTTADGRDRSPGNGVCETTVAGQCTLRAAIQEANATPAVDTVTVPAGEYVLTIAPAGDNGADVGDLDVTAPLTVVGAGSATTTVRAGSAPPGSPPEVLALDRILELHPSALGVSVAGVTLRGGYDAVAGGGLANASVGVVRLTDVVVRDNFATDEGGGIHNTGTLVLDRSVVTANTSGGSGGGIFTTGGSLRVTGTEAAPSRITANTAGNGAGIYDGGELTPAGLASGLTLERAVVADNVAHDTGGGVLADQQADARISDSVFEGNQAESAGAGLAVVQKAALTLTRTTFTANVSAGDGGGAYTATEGSVRVSDSTFTANRAGSASDPEPDGSGGGLSTDGGGSVRVERSSFVANTAASDGGGLFVDNFGAVEVTDTEVRGNVAGGVGGGVENSGNQVTFRRVRVTANRAEASGGGVHSSGSGMFSLLDSELSTNTAQTGGGLTNDADGGLLVRGTTVHSNRARHGNEEESGLGGGVFVLGDAGITIENSTISGNQAQSRGGGLYSDADAGLSVASTTIVNNSAPVASGVGGEIGSPNLPVLPSTSVVFANSIVAGNTLSENCSFALGSTGGNIDSGRSCYFQGPGDRTNTLPEYDALADNGGPTPTHALTAASIAVDSAHTCVATDQRGVSRPRNGRCDSGAYEWEGPFAPADNDPPDTVFDGGPVQDTENTSLFYFHGVDATTPAGLLQFECRLIEGDPTEVPEIPDPTQPPVPEFAFVPCPSPWQVPIVEEGAFTFEVRAIDRSGNTDPTPAVHRFTGGLDFTGPQTFLDEKPPATGAGRSALFTFSAVDDVTPSQFLEFECRLDTNEPDAWLECTNPAVFSNLAVGTHRFQVRAADGSDNVGPAVTWEWQVGIAPDDCDSANVALLPTADAHVDEALPTANFAAEPFALAVRSSLTGGDARTLVRFPVTDDAPECRLTSATLRLHADGEPGRSLEARPLSAGFSEATLTWNLQPAAGPADAVTTSGEGYREWDVTARVASILAGTAANHGWSVRDAVLHDPAGSALSFASRETPQVPGVETRPQLVLRFEPVTGPPPPPPPAPAEPSGPAVSLVCGARVTTSIRLANDLLGCMGEGLVIGAPNIVVDLDGHRITSGVVVEPGEEDGLLAGIRNGGYANVTIRNGTVKGFGYGVRLLGSTAYGVVHGMTLDGNVVAGVELYAADNGRVGSTVRDNHFVANGAGVHLVSGSRASTVRGNTFLGNGGVAVLIEGASGHLVEGNDISGVIVDPLLDSDGGIMLVGATGNRLLANRLSDAGDAGMLLSAGAHRNHLEGNVVVRTSDSSITVDDSDDNVVVGNVAHQSGGAGISAGDAHRTVITGNDARFNPGGIELSSADDSVVTGNDVSGSGADGIVVEGGTGIRVANNQANRTRGSGIAMEGDAVDALGNPVGNVVEGNTANQNLADGITVAGGGHRITANNAHHNRGFGIAGAEGVVDGGGNQASGNGEAVQCVNVVCATPASPVPVVPADTMAPETVITSGPPGGVAGTTGARIEFTGSDNEAPASALRFECRLDPGPDPVPEPTEPPEPPEPGDPVEPVDPVDPTDPNTWEECASPALLAFLEPGPHRFQVRAIDPSDNRDYSHAEVTFEVIAAPTDPAADTRPPTVTIYAAPDDPTSATSALLRFRASDNLTPGWYLRYECSLDGAPFASCTSPAYYEDLALTEPGLPHQFRVRAIDLMGNVSLPLTHSWEQIAPPADADDPETTITSAPDPLVVDPAVAVAFKADEAATFACSLDGAPFAPCTSPVAASPTAIGVHTMAVVATDPAGNADDTPAVATWELLPAPAPAALSCGAVVTTSVRLTADLTDCAGDGLVVGAGRIVIDLDGHTIDGVGLAAGVRVAGHDGVRVTNGRVAEFDSGVVLEPGTSGAIVEHLRLELHQVYAVELDNADQAGTGNTVRDNLLAGNATGIALLGGTDAASVLRNAIGSSSGYGLELVDAHDSLVEGNTVGGSSNAGLFAQASTATRVVANSFSAIADQAVVIEAGSDRSVVEDNAITSSEGGIYVSDASHVRIVDNLVHGSSDNGLSLEAVDAASVIGNELRFNGGGIEASETTDVVIEGNDLSQNGVGLELGESTGARVVGNTADGNDAVGITVEGDAPFGYGNLLDANSASGNGGDGIELGGIGHTLRANSANNNQGWGIHAAAATFLGRNVDAGANTAVGNVELPQCFQVACNGATPVPDRQPPDTLVVSGPDPVTAGAEASFAFEGLDDAQLGLRFQCSLDGAAFGACTSPWTYPSVTVGAHTFAVRAVDAALNADPSPATWSWIYSPPPPGTAPETTIAAGPDRVTVATSATFSFGSNEPDAGFACSTDGAAFVPCVSPHTRTGLAVGAHTFAVRAVDAELIEDPTPASFAWTIVAPPTPATVSCGQVLAQSTLVLNDLTDCPADGLIVGANNVTIDLGGRTLDGIGLGAGVRNPGYDGVTVTGGTVGGFDEGVALMPGAADNVVADLRAIANEVAGVSATGATRPTLRELTLNANGSGVVLTTTTTATLRASAIGLNSGPAVHLSATSGSRVEGNVLRDNGPGVVVEGSDANTLEANTLSRNDGGIEIAADPDNPTATSDANVVRANVLRASGGIAVDSATATRVEANDVRQSGATAITLEASTGTVVVRNLATANSGGIELLGSAGNRIESNRISASAGGITLEAGSIRNLVLANTVSGNDGDGIVVADNVAPIDGSTIEANTAQSNAASGIAVLGSGHTVLANLAYTNGAWGIMAAPGTIDGGGNLAAGNVETAQCSGVVCQPGAFAVIGLPDTELVLIPTDPSNSRTATFTFTGSDDSTEPANLGFQCRLDSTLDTAWEDCDNPWVVPGLTAGAHTFEVRAVDDLENVDPSPARRDWTVVLPPPGVPPDTTIDLAPPAASPLLEGVFTYSSNEADVTFECSLDGSAFAACESFYEFAFEDFEVGTHTFAVRARDFEGLADPTPAVHTWRVIGVLAVVTAGPAYIAPSEPGEPAEGGETESRDATIEFTATDPESSFFCSLDFEPFAACPSPFERTGLAVGPHLFRVYAVDSDGVEQEEPTEYGWEVLPVPDVNPPTTTITSAPASGTPGMTFTFTGADAETPEVFLTFECSIDGGVTWNDCVSPFNLLTAFPELAPGTYTLLVRALDGAEPEPNADPTPATHTWVSTADTTGPTVVGLSGPPSPSAALEPVFTFSGADNASPPELLAFECSLAGPVAPAEPFEACTSAHTLQNLTAGAHTLSVRAVDLAGNTGPASTWTWTVLGPPVVTIAAGPTLDASGQTTATTATFSFSSQPTGASYLCGLDGAEPAPCATATAPTVTYTDLAGGPHELVVLGVLDGFTSEPVAFEWVVIAPPDTDPPETVVASGPPAQTVSSTATFTFGADEAGVRFECALDGGSFGSCSPTTVLSDVAVGSHTLAVRAVDAADNVDATPATWAWERLGPPDTVIDVEPPDPTESTSVTIAFSTPSTDPSVSFECSLDGAAWAACPSPVTYTGLGVGAHTFAVRAVHPTLGADETPDDTDWTVVAPTPPETSLLTGPEGLTTSTSATFTFIANEAGVTYACSLDGAPFTTCASPVTYTGLAVGLHHFAVRATDPGGSTDPSPSNHFWTVEAPDTTPPETTLTATPPASTSDTSATFAFGASEAGTTFRCALDGAVPAACTSPLAFTGLAVGAHTFSVHAVDGAGNADPSPASFSWTVAPPPPDCGAEQVFTASGDAWLDQSAPATNKGTDSDLKVVSKGSGQNARTLVRFTMPSLPAGCAVQSAILRVFAASATSGRTLQALRVTGSWTESAVNWSTHPATAGAAATASSATGWREWAVAAQVTASYSAGSHHGFLLRDAAENAGGVEQKFNSREQSTNRPQLVLRLVAAAPTGPPPADTTAPTTTITSPVPGASATSVSITFTADEAGVAFACSLDGAAFAACTSPATRTVAPGSHTFSVRATDAAGNAGGVVSQTWTTSAPTTTVSCGSAVTVNASADAWVSQNGATSNFGTDSVLKVRSKSQDAARALVAFSLPAVPAGCRVESATLRMFADSNRSGRTLRALRLAGAWTEAGVTWANQPAASATVASTSSGSGWRQWTVSSHVTEMYAPGANHGFLIRDANEGNDHEQSFFGREKGQNPPQLVIQFAPA